MILHLKDTIKYSGWDLIPDIIKFYINKTNTDTDGLVYYPSEMVVTMKYGYSYYELKTNPDEDAIVYFVDDGQYDRYIPSWDWCEGQSYIEILGIFDISDLAFGKVNSKDEKLKKELDEILEEFIKLNSDKVCQRVGD